MACSFVIPLHELQRLLTALAPRLQVSSPRWVFLYVLLAKQFLCLHFALFTLCSRLQPMSRQVVELVGHYAIWERLESFFSLCSSAQPNA